MSSIKPQTLKGFRDFLPIEARKRQYVINALKSVFESYGFEPLETPSLEYEEILLGKYGEEGDKLMYRFEDKGKRKVALRYDQTVPLARVVAQYQNEIPMPFKRYQIQNVWRAENTQKGRFREFLQCDIDTVGQNSGVADAEIIVIVADSLEKLGFSAKGGSASGGKNFKIRIGDRKLFQDIPPSAITIIDKLAKIGEEKVIAELKEKSLDEKILDKLKNAKPSEDIELILGIAQEMGVADKVYFDPTLARGLDYYTGMILEVEIDGYSAGSVCGGGRYDNLIGLFANKQIPAVGFAFGFDRLMEAMDELNLFPKDLTTTKVLVTVMSMELGRNSIEIADLLRKNGINAELWLDSDSKMEKQLKYADKKQIPYVIIIGEKEASKNLITLRNMKTREQKTISLKEVIAKLAD